MAKTIDNMTRAEFGEWLRQQRKERGLNMQEMAKQVGLSAQQLQNYEHGGVVTPRFDGVLKLASAYGLDLSEVGNVFRR